jgi:phosphate-selective porin OprO and OprP
MQKLILSLVFISALSTMCTSQITTERFGKGLQFEGKDSTFYLKLGFRFQNQFAGTWSGIEGGTYEEFNAAFVVRRSRIKLDGWAYSPKLKYKLELAMTNRDMSGGGTKEFSGTPNYVLDAWVAWNFYKNFTIQMGQGKLPGNRERVISSGDLQFVDRSILNSRFNIDRDQGLQLKHHFKIANQFVVKEIVALSQGEGRNVTAGHFDGFDYTFRVEMLPFGNFQSKGDYVGAAITREDSPKLSVAASYDINENAVRERGQLGSFITDDAGIYFGRTLHTSFADMMFKYKGISVMLEYAERKVKGSNSIVLDAEENEIGTFYTGNAFNAQAGYLFENNFEIAARYTDLNPDEEIATSEEQYTVGLSKYIVGHKLKFQTDYTYIDKFEGSDQFMVRAQVDIHF